jgi:hypothetical protein
MSEQTTRIIDELAALERDGLDGLTLAEVTALLAAAIRLATARAEQEDEQLPLSDRDVSATQAVSVASALLHAQHLNAFDLELWSAGKYVTH